MPRGFGLLGVDEFYECADGWIVRDSLIELYFPYFLFLLTVLCIRGSDDEEDSARAIERWCSMSRSFHAAR